MLILDQAALTKVLQTAGVQARAAWWEIVPDPTRWTVPVARRAERLLQKVAHDAIDSTTAIGSVLQSPGVSDDPQGSVDHAEEATVTGSATIGPTVLGSIGVALLVLADAAQTWTERRRQELRILRMRGAGGWLVACKGLLELGPPIVLGSAAGFASGDWLVRSYGPSSAIPAEVVHDALVAASLSTVVALAAASLVVGFAHADDTSRARRMVGLSIGGVTALVLGAAAYYELRSRGSGIVRSNVGSHVDTLVLLFPTLLIVGISAIVSQLVLHPRLIRRVSRRMPIGWWLAARRLASRRRRAMLVATGTAVAVGSVVFAASVSSTLRATITAKATLGVGAAQVVPLYGAGTLSPGSALEARSTRVLRTSEPTVVVAGHQPADVIGVDPSTFARAAFWDSSFSSRSLGSLLGSIAVDRTGSGAIAVLAVGGGFPDRFSITLATSDGRVTAPVEVVNRPTAFPGLGYGSTRPLLVVNADALIAIGASFDEQLWFRGDDPGLLDEVRAAGLDATVVRRASNLVSGDLQPQLWALGFLKVLGIVSAVVAVSALVLYHAAIGRRRAVGDSMCAYLGMSTRSALVASALESGVMALTGLVLGVGSSWLAVALVYRHLDTAPETPPAPLLRLDVAGAALGLLGVAVVASLTAALLETRRRRTSLDQVLRNAG
jgi:putative ABC transport system permease protein